MNCVAMDEGGIPFNTQFFQDDFNDGADFDDDIGPSGIDPAEQDLLAATQGQSRRVRPERVNFTKKAKKVDVRKLKDNIWKGLDIICPEKKEDDEEDVSMVRRSVASPLTFVLSYVCLAIGN